VISQLPLAPNAPKTSSDVVGEAAAHRRKKELPAKMNHAARLGETSARTAASEPKERVAVSA
jgi:hypothetical protein